MDRSLTPQERSEYAAWLVSSSLSTHEPNDEMLISFKLAKGLGASPTKVIRASRGQKGQADLVTKVESALAADPDVQHWMDGRVRRLRFAAKAPSAVEPARAAVSLGEAANICECSTETVAGYRVRTMLGHGSRGLADEEFRPEEVVAVYIATALEGARFSRSAIDAFVIKLLGAFPDGEDWAVIANQRQWLAVIDSSQVGQLGKRNAARWVRPDGAYAKLRELGCSPT